MALWSEGLGPMVLSVVFLSSVVPKVPACLLLGKPVNVLRVKEAMCPSPLSTGEQAAAQVTSVTSSQLLSSLPGQPPGFGHSPV